MDSLSTSNNNDANIAQQQQQQQQQQHGSGWHMWLMMACCLAPLAAILAVTVFGVPFSGVLTFALVLLCPLMMVFMMTGGHGHGAAESAQPEPTGGARENGRRRLMNNPPESL